ncbi:hypothetical protein POM88_032654 [Heracleum sosnowskyi]|uniref:Uncharacterized protein n=1 Tax=Heracleum sosnowskyi TaxID=360622 RepID=A0AAD8I022_9APIA|nr:hypothetical protein POM88_032654 [Heracleum sosnowskyi]
MMATLTNFNYAKITAPKLHHYHRRGHPPTLIQATISGDENATQKRRKFMTSLVATSIVIGGLNNVTAPIALAENWGEHVGNIVMERSSYVKTANELVDNLSEFDKHVRSPRIYESYLYYEKTLKSIDELVALLA